MTENEMLLFSPSSTSPNLAEPDDALYRLAPVDTKQGQAIARANIIKDDQLPVIELQIRNSSFYFTNNLLKELSRIYDNVS